MALSLGETAGRMSPASGDAAHSRHSTDTTESTTKPHQKETEKESLCMRVVKLLFVDLPIWAITLPFIILGQLINIVSAPFTSLFKAFSARLCPLDNKNKPMMNQLVDMVKEAYSRCNRIGKKPSTSGEEDANKVGPGSPYEQVGELLSSGNQ